MNRRLFPVGILGADQLLPLALRLFEQRLQARRVEARGHAPAAGARRGAVPERSERWEPSFTI